MRPGGQSEVGPSLASGGSGRGDPREDEGGGVKQVESNGGGRTEEGGGEEGVAPREEKPAAGESE